jgi:histidine triad (HIT) family protein
MEPECIFCELANDPARQLRWQNDVAVAFNDRNPQAPVHVLVVPRVHVKNLDALDDEALAGRLLMAVREVIQLLGLVEANQVVIHGEQIDHLHFHVMSDNRYTPPTA